MWPGYRFWQENENVYLGPSSQLLFYYSSNKIRNTQNEHLIIIICIYEFKANYFLCLYQFVFDLEIIAFSEIII